MNNFSMTPVYLGMFGSAEESQTLVGSDPQVPTFGVSASQDFQLSVESRAKIPTFEDFRVMITA